MGTWNFTYDAVDRLTTAQNSAATAIAPQYANKIGCWSYDSYGNRTMEAVSSTACNANPTPQIWATYNPANNRITADTNRTSNFGYDASGNTQNDGINNYWYDAEGQLCAVQLAIGGTITQYIYDAEGARIGKGTLSTAPAMGTLCAPLGASGSGLTSGQGFALSTRWLVDLGGEQVTELNSAGNWQHSNIFAGGKLTATYDYNGGHGGLHFELADPLGTKRVQANVSGWWTSTAPACPSATTWATRWALTVLGTDDATEHHFTQRTGYRIGKRLLLARYYSSALGRFMSPDWSAKLPRSIR